MAEEEEAVAADVGRGRYCTDRTTEEAFRDNNWDTEPDLEGPATAALAVDEPDPDAEAEDDPASKEEAWLP